MKSIKKAYAEELRKRPRADDGEAITALPAKKRGRRFFARPGCRPEGTTDIPEKVREGGGAISARIVVAAARGILLKCNRSMLAEYCGPVQLSRTWAHSLLKQMKFVQWRATTSKSKHTVQNFSQLKEVFLVDVTATVTMEEVPPELILNWDQTGIKFVPNSSRTMARHVA